MGQGQRGDINLDGQPYQAKRPGRPGRLYLDGSECQLHGMANERVAEKCLLAEGMQVSWSLPKGLGASQAQHDGTTARAVHLSSSCWPCSSPPGWDEISSSQRRGGAGCVHDSELQTCS